MSQLKALDSQITMPDLVATAGERAQYNYIDFFVSTIRNKNTRMAYNYAAKEFLIWCEQVEIRNIADIRSLHVAAWVESISKESSPATVKLRLSAIRHLFDWMVMGQIIPHNPAVSVRGPRYSARIGKTPVLSPEETRQILDSIDTTKLIGLRDRALIGLMVYTFARISAAVNMKVGDVYIQNRRLWLSLQEKGGKQAQLPCHHTLEEYLTEYLDTADLWQSPKSPLFPSAIPKTNKLTDLPLHPVNAYAMVIRRSNAAGIKTKICNHTFRGTGITTFLENKGSIEIAAEIANHASVQTTRLYDRRSKNLTLDEIEKIHI